MRDPKPVEQLGHALATGVRDIGSHAQVREQRVLLEDEADAALLRSQRDPARRVEPDPVAQHHAASSRTCEAGDHAKHGRLARSRGADERDRPLDLERERQLEVAKRKRKVDAEGSHLSVTRRAALIRTSSALTASATSKLTSNCAYTASGSVCVTPRRLP